MLSKFLIPALLLNLIVISSANAGDAWQWNKECVPGTTTTCEVWFNSLILHDKVVVKKDASTLSSEYKRYVKLESESINAILLHAAFLESAVLNKLKMGLNDFITATKSFQKISGYYSGASFKPLATFGSTKDALKNSISGLDLDAEAKYALKHLESLISIVEGTQSNKKVIYWITQGSKLTATQIKNLKTKLVAAKIRLVITHLQLSDTAQNSNSSLRKLATSAGGIYQQVKLDKWQKQIAVLANYSVNGGIIKIKSDDLCGKVKLQFSATPAATSNWQGQYPRCVQPQSPPPAQPETESPTTPAPPTEEPPTGTEGDTDSPSEGESGDDTGSQNETAEEVSSNWIAVAAGTGLLVLLIVIILIMKSSKKSKTVTTPPANRSYGALVNMSGAETRSYSLETDAVKIGRSQECEIVLIDDSVSAIHAELKRQRDGSVTLIDLKSSNGTRVNDKDVEHHTVLKSGDIVQLGEARLQFKLY